MPHTPTAGVPIPLSTLPARGPDDHATTALSTPASCPLHLLFPIQGHECGGEQGVCSHPDLWPPRTLPVAQAYYPLSRVVSCQQEDIHERAPPSWPVTPCPEKPALRGTRINERTWDAPVCSPIWAWFFVSRWRMFRGGAFLGEADTSRTGGVASVKQNSRDEH